MKKIFRYVIYGLYFSLIFYFGIEAKKFGILSSMDFVSTYFDSYSRYLFICNIIIVVVLFCNTVPYLKAEIFCRIKENIFYFVIKNSIKIAIFYVIFTIFSLILVSIIFDFTNPLSILNLSFFIRISTFFIYCIMFYNVIYISTNKRVLSLSLVLAINFLILIGILNINYFVYMNNVNQNFLTCILFFYNIIFIIISLIFFYYKSLNKELLKYEG